MCREPPRCRSRVLVEGKLDYGEYVDKNSVRRQATTIIAGLRAHTHTCARTPNIYPLGWHCGSFFFQDPWTHVLFSLSRFLDNIIFLSDNVRDRVWRKFFTSAVCKSEDAFVLPPYNRYKVGSCVIHSKGDRIGRDTMTSLRGGWKETSKMHLCIKETCRHMPCYCNKLVMLFIYSVVSTLVVLFTPWSIVSNVLLGEFLESHTRKSLLVTVVDNVKEACPNSLFPSSPVSCFMSTYP